MKGKSIKSAGIMKGESSEDPDVELGQLNAIVEGGNSNVSVYAADEGSSASGFSNEDESLSSESIDEANLQSGMPPEIPASPPRYDRFVNGEKEKREITADDDEGNSGKVMAMIGAGAQALLDGSGNKEYIEEVGNAAGRSGTLSGMRKTAKKILESDDNNDFDHLRNAKSAQQVTANQATTQGAKVAGKTTQVAEAAKAAQMEMVKKMISVRAAKVSVEAASKTSKVVAAAATASAAKAASTVTIAGISMTKAQILNGVAAILLIGGVTTLAILLTRQRGMQEIVRNCGVPVEKVSAGLIFYMEGLQWPFTTNESILVQDGIVDIYNNLREVVTTPTRDFFKKQPLRSRLQF